MTEKTETAAGTQDAPGVASAGPQRPLIVRTIDYARKTIVGERVAEATTAPAPRASSGFSGYFLSFMALVALPSLAAILYLALIASNQYVAEARFAVRSPFNDSGLPTQKSGAAKDQTSSGGGALTLSLAGQDAYVVSGYIRSPAIFADLPETIQVREIFQRPEADFWARLKASASREELAAYWQGMVTTYVDGPSGIVGVTVRAFRPKDAYDLAQAIVAASEKLVNTLSARARQDAVARAEAEARRAEGVVAEAIGRLRAFRDAEGLISPGSAAENTAKLLLQAMGDKIRAQNELHVAMRTMSANAPTLEPIRQRLIAIERQIVDLRAQLTGQNGDKAVISAQIAKFEDLELQRVISEKIYTAAQESLERTRALSLRQELYLSVFVPPSIAEDALFPERLNLSLLIPVGLLMLWGILALGAAAIEDHTF